MEMARDDAWRYAVKMAGTTAPEWPAAIEKRDQEVATLTRLISAPGWLVSLAMKVIRMGEKGTVREKIARLNKKTTRIHRGYHYRNS